MRHCSFYYATMTIILSALAVLFVIAGTIFVAMKLRTRRRSVSKIDDQTMDNLLKELFNKSEPRP